MKTHLLNAAMVILIGLTISSCKKTTMTTGLAPDAIQTPGLFILSGETVIPASSPTSSNLSFYNFNSKQFTANTNFTVNGETDAYVGGDVKIYGSKIYIAVTTSGVVEIVDLKTGKLLKTVTVLGADLSTSYRYPASIAFSKNTAYVSCYDGTIATIDTASFSLNTSLNLGINLGGMVVQNNKLYVAAWGGADGACNTVSVIDLNTNKEIKRVSVIPNPVSLAADNYGNVYASSASTSIWQGFMVSSGGLSIIDSKADTVKTTIPGTYPAKRTLPISAGGDFVYYATSINNIAMYNANTQTPVAANFITDGTTILCASTVCVNPTTGEVYVADAKDSKQSGVIDVFSQAGKLEYSFSTGVLPVAIKLSN